MSTILDQSVGIKTASGGAISTKIKEHETYLNEQRASWQGTPEEFQKWADGATRSFLMSLSGLCYVDVRAKTARGSMKKALRKTGPPKIGRDDRVRVFYGSYRRVTEGPDANFMEGLVTEIVRPGVVTQDGYGQKRIFDCEMYRIRVTRQVHRGREATITESVSFVATATTDSWVERMA